MATNTINFNPPTIKAARITGRGGSSGGSGGANWSGIGKSIASVGTSIAAGIKERNANIQYEKLQQQRLLKEREDLRVLQYDKVAMIDTLPNTTFEESKNNLLYGLMDDFVKIKSQLNDPNSTLDRGVGQRALIEINQTVAKYKQSAPAVLAAATYVKDSLSKPFGTAGAMAGGVPTEQQKILLELVEGGNVEIGGKDGDLYLYKKDDNDNVTGVFNIAEYMRITDNGTNPDAYFRTVPDIAEESKTGVDILGSQEAPNTAYYTLGTTETPDGKNVISSITWGSGQVSPEQAKNTAIVNVGRTSFNHLLEDNKYLQEMEDLWNDTIGADSKGISGQDVAWNPMDDTKRKYSVKGYIDEGTGEFVFDPNGNITQVYKDPMGNELELTQKEFAQRWLAENAIQKYGIKTDRIKSVKGKEKGSKGGFYDVDAAISIAAPLVTGYFMGEPTSFKLEKVEPDNPATWVYSPIRKKEGVPLVDSNYGVNIYALDSKGNVKKDKKGNPIINYTKLRSQMGSKLRNVQ